MAAPYTRLTAARRWVAVVTCVAVLAGLVIAIAAIVFWIQGRDDVAWMPLLSAGLMLLVAGGMFTALANILLKIEDDEHRVHELLIETRGLQDRQTSMLEIIRDNSRISDAAKSITHRELERDALRKAIREDIVKEDWEAAYSLIDEMESRFGYRVEAYNYRKEVDEFRAKVIEDRLQSSMRHIRRLADDGAWDDAAAEAARLLKLAPQDDRVAEIITELNNKRETQKQDLLQRWHQAVEQKDLDEAIQLMKLIDPFLTREEVEKLEDTARSVFKAKLLDHAAQFRGAVTEKRWEDAIRIGEQICGEFPNSLMAKEVTESMEALKAKAARAAASPT